MEGRCDWERGEVRPESQSFVQKPLGTLRGVRPSGVAWSDLSLETFFFSPSFYLFIWICTSQLQHVGS